MTRNLLSLLLLAAGAWAADPVRVAIYTSNPQLLPEALQLFEKTYGKELVDLRLLDAETAPDRLADANVIYIYLMPAELYRRFHPAAQFAVGTGARLMAQPFEFPKHRWQLDADAAKSAQAYEYWNYGGVENMAAFLAFCYRAGGGVKPLEIPAPKPQIITGIYHPQSKTPFLSLADYLDWYRARGLVMSNAPLAGILFWQTNLKNRDMQHIDALIAALEKRGVGAVPVFGWPVSTLGPLLGEPGKSPLRVLYAFSLGFAQQADSDLLEQYGIHVIDLMTARDSYDVWKKSPFGITPERLSTQVALPEIAGATEPLVVATQEKVAGITGPVTVPIPERIDMAVRRGLRWFTLQEKPNSEKRIGLVYFNNPPGKGNIGASYLDVFPTLQAVMARLRDEGYLVTGSLPDKKELEAMLEKSGRNIELWAPGELDAMVERGHVTLVSMKKYKSWFATLPKEFREFVLQGWGPPEKSTLMTVASRDGEKFFVVPGIRIGNLFLGPQPLRTSFERNNEIAHNINIPPPHSYIAAYLWYRKEFRADAVVHFGRHGNLEFLPGKNVGLAGWDSAEAILDDLPHAYYYIIDGGGESTTARRRSAAVMVSHLTPMAVSGGQQDQFSALRRAFLNIEKLEALSPALEEQYRQSALTEIRKLNLDSQLAIDLVKAPWKDVHEKVEAFLEATEAGPIPMGIHTVGQLPEEWIQKEALAEFFKLAFTDADRKTVAPLLSTWTSEIFAGKPLSSLSSLSPALRDKVQTASASCATWLHNLRISPARELDSLVTVLHGRFEPSGMSGDPLRTPASIPSGRNIHDFDPNLIPTREAWELGKKMGVGTLDRFQKETGKLPEKVSMVLWYGETIRHQGAMEAEALYLMGVEPKWNGRGAVDGLRLIPVKELGRPRIDVVLTLGGIYRDGFPDKVLLLDRASRLAAADGDNAISRNTRKIAAALKAAGVAPEIAEKAARARSFAAAPGDYGGGIANMVKQSKDAGNAKGLAAQYLNHMNHAYSTELWGEAVPSALSRHLEGNQAVIHSRATNIYGVLDNDDFYDFAGGLNAATKDANAGAAPAFYVNDMKTRGKERVTDLKTTIATELNARYWNPKWIREMQKSGYAGAREIADTSENLYGWQATSAEHMDGTFWQNTYDVYVGDKHGLNMDEFFEKSNPHARQFLLARLLEVDRQGSYKFSEQDRAQLITRYVKTVAKLGATCSANTCGNLKLHQYVAQQAALITGLGDVELKSFGRQMARATHWNSAQFAGAPAAVRNGIRAARQPRPQPEHQAVNPGPAAPANRIVTGYRMAETVLRTAAPRGVTQAALRPIPVLSMLALIAAGALLEWRRRPAFPDARK